ncbi:hypothetical protein ARZXY2_4900 (plasmid) [Arthrobacter sp. ZXY-2]|nr:hypothetical protein ARZXY2_4900 [Arthrobacter sp. ZXY-2]
MVMTGTSPGRRSSLAQAADSLRLQCPSVLYLLDGPTFPVGDGGSWLKSLILTSLAKFGAGAAAVAPQLGADDALQYERMGVNVIWLDPEDYFGDGLLALCRTPVSWVFTDSLETSSRTIGCTKSADRAVLMMDDYASNRGRNRIGDVSEHHSRVVQGIIDTSRLTIWRSSRDMASYVVPADRSLVVDGFERRDEVGICAEGPVAMLANFMYPPNREALIQLIGLDWGGRQLKLIGRIDRDLHSAATRLGHICTGLVPDPREELMGCSAGIDPVTQGSGLSTKLTVYVSVGLPAIATEVAVRGLDPDLVRFLTIMDDSSQLPRLTETWDYPKMCKAAKQARGYARANHDLSNQLNRLSELMS